MNEAQIEILQALVPNNLFRCTEVQVLCADAEERLKELTGHCNKLKEEADINLKDYKKKKENYEVIVKDSKKHMH